jgi:hypothetical protein
MTRRTPPRCACGCTYEEHRTGLTFGDVRRMMFDQVDPNRPGWYRQKRRRSVLGYWRELKMHLWHSTHGYCEAREAA